MDTKFSKFSYQPVESTHQGFKEVLVTFEYKNQPARYYVFVKEQAKVKKSYYLEEAKEQIKKMIATGQLERCAKRYLHYKVKKEDRLIVVSKVPVKVHNKNGFVPCLISIVLGALLLLGGLGTIVYRFAYYGNYPEYFYTDAELLKMSIHLYTGIALGAVGVILLAVMIPLMVKKVKLSKKLAKKAK